MSHEETVDSGVLNSHNAEYLELLLSEYRRDTSRVPPEWRRVFQQLLGRGHFVADGFEGNVGCASQSLQRRVDRLVYAYRSRGHLAAQLDPLELAPRDESVVDPKRFGLEASDADQSVVWDVVSTDADRETTIGALQKRLADIYCGSIGFEFLHVDDLQHRAWLRERIEQTAPPASLPHATQLQMLAWLTDAVMFEQYVRKKYVGAKTFSLEGAETLIPLLHLALDAAANQGVAEVVVGMAHRGRLNVLANIVGKRPVDIFREFEDQHPDWWRGRGDVKYHLGASGDWESADGKRLHVSLCFNPSHLEFISPVALGRVRAKQDRAEDWHRERGMVLLIHGDAGFAGEGVVQESLNLSALADYHTGGTLHVVVNNQLGFTTPPAEGRSTRYATDIAKAFGIPIFHVNCEDLPAVIRVVRLAMDYRAAFGRDVVIDLICFRRWGHNEADEPSFTQPLMYQAIEHRPSIRESYLSQLLDAQAITRTAADQLADDRQACLKREFEEAQQEDTQPADPPPAGAWEPYRGGPEPDDVPETGVAMQQLEMLLGKLTETPQGFHRHRKLQRSAERRRQMASGEEPLDWPAAEALAIATLAAEGHPVRLAGQDAARGTFSQRHAVLFDVIDGSQVNVFENLTDDQAPVEIINSPLSEAGALGFEYGFSLDYPEALVAWEAQYGDFANAGQVIIDQFIASAEDKWRRLSGVVLLLPHGYEGKGPEHSSARLERFLALAAEDNLQVVVPSTPAQYFHLLRRQVKRAWRKPLVVFTPKSLLRHPQSTSTLEQLRSGRFERLLQDDRPNDSATSCLLLTSGKLYFDLVAYREEHEQSDYAIVRIEQFYPLSDEALTDALSPYSADIPVRWVQEEPENLGAWPYWKGRYCDQILKNRPFSVVARPPSASPATGSHAAHKAEQRDLIERLRTPRIIMSIELKIPDVGESVREVEIGRWLKQEGDTVKLDEDLVELETDKASMELPAPADGVLSKILKQQGESVNVGEVVGYLDEATEATEKTEETTEESPSADKEESADQASKDEAPKNEAPKAQESKDDESKGDESDETEARTETDDVIATPSARRALREHGLELSEIEHSGQRIERDDVLRHLEKQSEAKSSAEEIEERKPSKSPRDEASGATSDAREETVPMSLIRRRIAERLVQVQRDAALLTTFNEIDLSAVKSLRTANQERFQGEHGVKLGYMSFFVKAVVDALKQVSGLNAEVRGQQIVYRNYYNICIAIGSDKGLVTPVLRDADKLSFAEIELAIDDFAKRASENKLSPQDLQGGTFTITNGGIYGSLLSTPIVNPPQSGVLGMHAIQDRPVVRDGEIVIRPMMYVALTYDHRLVDGREAVTFLKCVKEDIETPARMLLDV